MSEAEPLTGVPRLLYGTAWKEDHTEALTRMALEVGYRGIDTANQRRHYHEAGVGAAVKQAIADGLVSRDDLFLQTKFTHRPGQDHRLPYEPEAPTALQVEQSFRSSLEHLHVDALDSYVLHGPLLRAGLHAEDVAAWRAMESIHQAGGARVLGVSNVSREQLQALCDLAEVQPAFVQNRCFARLGWDAPVRDFCHQHGIVYQGFSLLTANPEVIGSPEVRAIAEQHACTVPQVVFAFARQVGMLPLTGTTDRTHATEDLASVELELSEQEFRVVMGR